MAIRRNDEERLVIWPEATLGTRPGVPDGKVMRIFDQDLGCTEAIVENNVIRYDMNTDQPGRGRWKLEGKKANVPLERSESGIWLKAYFGAPTTTGAADPYTHTFKRTVANGPSFGAEVWNAANSKGDQLDGLVVYGLEFTIDAEDGLISIGVMIAGIGKQTLDQGVEVDATPTAFTDDEFLKLDAQIKIDNTVSDHVVSGTVRLEREISIRAIPDTNDYAKHIILGKEKPSWNLTGLFDSTSEVRALATGRAQHSIELLFGHPSNANHSLSIKSEKALLYLTNNPSVGQGNEREITIEGQGHPRGAASASQILAVLKNPDATISF